MNIIMYIIMALMWRWLGAQRWSFMNINELNERYEYQYVMQYDTVGG